MAATGSTSALKRKMDAARGSSRGGGRTALRALRLALARSAADLFGLPLAVIGATQGRCLQEHLDQHLAGDRLLILLDGPGGQTGALSLDRTCITALIQQQTMGQVTGAAPTDRPFTGTDAAMAAPLIDAMLDRAADLSELPADRRCMSDYRFGARAEDARSLMLALDNDRYRTFELLLDFAAGKQKGALDLILPEAPEQSDTRTPHDGAASAEDNDGAGSLGGVRASLTAVISSLRVPLADLAAMKPGDLLPVSNPRFDKTDLLTISGQKVAVGRLGQVGGMRAIRLNETERPIVPEPGEPGPEFAASIDATPAPPMPPPLHSADADIPANPGMTIEAKAQLPAVTSEDNDRYFDNLSPEEAAAQISELAGLTQDETDEIDGIIDADALEST